jgi:type IV secretory pathway component VirB8
MSITTSVPDEAVSAERWRQWHLRNAESSRNSATRARIVFTVLFTALAACLGLQFLSSPLPF